ncbi:MAG: hypothetical protein JWP81_2951 [Ferruginibacter sp.]|nr:hypothetical protein [Ferruginibacter sp.]
MYLNLKIMKIYYCDDLFLCTNNTVRQLLTIFLSIEFKILQFGQNVHLKDNTPAS